MIRNIVKYTIHIPLSIFLLILSPGVVIFLTLLGLENWSRCQYSNFTTKDAIKDYFKSIINI